MQKIIRAATVPQSLDVFCKGMLKELSEKYEVVALSSPGESLDRVREREGVRTIAVSMERHISLFKDFKTLIKMIGVFRKEKPTMVHSMTPKAGLICMMAGWLTRASLEVRSITANESAHKDTLYKLHQEIVPIGLIDDVEVVFLHYKTFDEAVEKWNRRKSRINWDNLYNVFPK